MAWHFSKHLNGNTDKRSIVASFQDAVTLHPTRTPDLQFFLRLLEGASLQVFFYIYLRELVTKLRDDLGNKSAFVLSTDRPTNQPTYRSTNQPTDRPAAVCCPAVVCGPGSPIATCECVYIASS